jgi:hypothetical protein
MAVVAAPLVIIAADALVDAIVLTAAAITTAVGAAGISKAIDKSFPVTESSSTTKCPKKQKCGEDRAGILNKYQKLGKELRKYDPAADAIGGFRHAHGVTKPCGHYIEISDLQRGLKTTWKGFTTSAAIPV